MTRKQVSSKKFVIVGTSKVYGPCSTGYLATTDTTFEPQRVEVYEGKLGEELLTEVFYLKRNENKKTKS